MNSKTLICAFLLALCLITAYFSMPVYAAAADDEILTVNAAWVDGEMLRINVTDANGISSALALRLSDYVSDAENNEYISIQAVDLAGNKSGVIEIKNPFYDPTAAPVVIPTGTTPTPTPTETPQNSQSVIPEGNKAFTPDGSGTVMDNVINSDGKEFFTIDTEDGSVFYLIVDRERNSDNVYLLNSVTLDDLIALAEKNDKILNVGNNGGTSAIPDPNQPNTTENPSQSPTAAPEPEAPAKSGNTSIIIFVIIAIVGVGGAGYYFKIVKGKKNAPVVDDDDDEDYDYEDEPEEPESYDDDESDYTSEDGGGDE